MKISFRSITLALIATAFVFPALSQDQYRNYRSMTEKASTLAKEYPALCTVKSLVKTAGGKDIYVLSIGTENKDMKPAVAVIGGIEGNHLLGRELVLGFAGELLKNSENQDIKKLLASITFYVIPDISPDASEQYFSPLKYERVTNEIGRAHV